MYIKTLFHKFYSAFYVTMSSLNVNRLPIKMKLIRIFIK